ncbi:hypothetical protein N7490_001991 [Penicillium lividum]|nr:hypothetical protein N7490_001991 [Penicillium lividum]
MRLKVLYTFVEENNTNCLVRWPHVLDIQTTSLNDDTTVGMVELKTCIQAIFSASVYAYDYAEYDTPLVGQGLLSWLLTTSSPKLEATAYQSKRMVNGRVCKTHLAFFSKRDQETLEVRFHLVPVPTVMQSESEYLESIQQYWELCNVIPGHSNAKSKTNIVHQSPALLKSESRVSSPMNKNGIGTIRLLLSEGSTPWGLAPSSPNQSGRSVSPPQSSFPRRVARRSSARQVTSITAESVNIHRSTLMSPTIDIEQPTKQPARTLTLMSPLSDSPHRGRASASLLRDSLSASPDLFPNTNTSPFMRSSHPVIGGSMDRQNIFLAPISLDTVCDFMTGELEEVFEGDTTTCLDDLRMLASRDTAEEKRVWTAVQDNSLATATSAAQETTDHPFPFNDSPKEQTSEEAQTTLLHPTRSEWSNSPSSDGACLAPNPQAPATLQSDVHNFMTLISSSDPMKPAHRSVDVEALPSANGSTELPKQVQARLDQAIRKRQGPPYCENCGSIETPAWRRAWSKEVDGSEKAAEEIMRDSSVLFWLALEYNTHGDLQKFKIYKKNLQGPVNGWVQILFCNPCGLWLYKAKCMRPENKWNKQLPEKKRKCPSRNRKDGPLNFCRTAKTRSKAALQRTSASPATSPEVIYAPAEKEKPNVGNDHDPGDEEDASPDKRLRENSAEPRRSNNAEGKLSRELSRGQDKIKALRNAIQFSPAKDAKLLPIMTKDDSIFPVQRSVPSNPCQESPLNDLDVSFANNHFPRCNTCVASEDKHGKRKEGHAPTPHVDLDDLFDSAAVEFD